MLDTILSRSCEKESMIIELDPIRRKYGRYHDEIFGEEGVSPFTG